MNYAMGNGAAVHFEPINSAPIKPRRKKYYGVTIQLPNPGGFDLEREVERDGWQGFIERQLGQWMRDTGICYRAPKRATMTPCGRCVTITIEVIGRSAAVMFALAHSRPYWSEDND